MQPDSNKSRAHNLKPQWAKVADYDDDITRFFFHLITRHTQTVQLVQENPIVL